MEKNNVQPLFGLEKTKKWQMVNKCNIVSWGGKWTNKALEKAMDVVERVTTSLRKANRTSNIFLTSLSSHMNGKLIWSKKNSKSISVRKM
jgi:hypothetical protein